MAAVVSGLAGPRRCWTAIRSRADSGQIRPFAARHVIGKLLDLSHVSWRTCVADLLADHRDVGTYWNGVLSVARRLASC